MLTHTHLTVPEACPCTLAYAEPNYRTAGQPPNRPAHSPIDRPDQPPTAPGVRCYATSRSRILAHNPTATFLSTARYHGSPIGKPEALMNWDAAALKRGPYILRIAHQNPPPRTIPCLAESLPLTSLTSPRRFGLPIRHHAPKGPPISFAIPLHQSSGPS
jgi:hypothetical protein